MALFRIPIACSLTYLLLLPQSLLLSQQPDIQKFVSDDADSPASSDGSDGSADVVTDTPNETYLETISKAESKFSQFRPTSSDLLIQQAEGKFRSGRSAYQIKDGGRARSEFDEAITLMLKASENPSDRRLYEDKLEQMVDSIHRMDLAGLGAAAPPSDEPQFEKAPLEDLLQMTFPVDPKLKTKVKEEVVTTTSQLPLTMNDAVVGYINYFSGRGHNTMIAGLQRAGKYRPMIQRIFTEEGVPQELIHLAQAESGFLPRAVSNKAATGMWQFVKFRGNEYGLHQTVATDDRLDPEKATRAAARHLKDLYNEFGNWYLAIAAYNCGPGAIERAVERTGYADFWELRARRAIPAETTNYVPIILAMTIMSKNAAEYGLTEVVPEAPVEYDTVEMQSATNLALVADATDTPVSQLMALNPALLRKVAPEGYALHVPKGMGETLNAALTQVPSFQRASGRVHRVESGDTLATIARRYGSTASQIAQANHLVDTEPEAGTVLTIPSSFRDESADKPPAAKRRPASSAAKKKTAVKRTAATAMVAKAK